LLVPSSRLPRNSSWRVCGSLSLVFDDLAFIVCVFLYAVPFSFQSMSSFSVWKNFKSSQVSTPRPFPTRSRRLLPRLATFSLRFHSASLLL
jgi:hypothetical protein